MMEMVMMEETRRKGKTKEYRLMVQEGLRRMV